MKPAKAINGIERSLKPKKKKFQKFYRGPGYAVETWQLEQSLERRFRRK